MNLRRPHKGNYRDILTTQGTNPELWKLFRARLALEGKSAGELLNELIERHKRDAEEASVTPDVTSPYEYAPENQKSLRGIDRELWRWLKSHCIMEEILLGEILNGLMHKYLTQVSDQPVELTKYYRECANCGTLFETLKDDAVTCSGKCRVARFRRLRSGGS